MADKVRRQLDANETCIADVLATHPRWAGKTVRRKLLMLSESGLYKLIMRSDKDTAEPFQNWVTQDVLPSIRKTGGYLLNENDRETAHADTREAIPLPEGIAEGDDFFSDLRKMEARPVASRSTASARAATSFFTSR